MKLSSAYTIISVVTSFSAFASVVCNVLPKAEVFNDYPRIKKAYSTGVAFVAAFAGNWRTNLHSVGSTVQAMKDPQLKLPLDQPSELSKGASNNV